MFLTGKLIFWARIPVKVSSKNTVGIDFLTATEYNSRVLLPGIKKVDTSKSGQVELAKSPYGT